MKQENKTKYIKVVADEGKKLTQKNQDVEERIFAVSVCTTHPELWEEWTDEQVEQWQAEHPQEEDWFEEIDGIESLEMGVV